LCLVAFTALSNDSNFRADRSGNASAASKAAARVPLGGINRSITAENVSARPFFHEASLV
jgi:hypothetical protein